MTEYDTDDERLDGIIAAATAAAPDLAAVPPVELADWLVAAAQALDADADVLVPLAARESHLAEGRLAGELTRTTFQLRLFARHLRDGTHLGATVDHADPDWPMGPRPDIRRSHVPIGPVLVFAASNFPFAFSVAGGDTASALAAGCPVVLKAHPGHPELSTRTGAILRAALVAAGAPEGVFDVVHGVDAGVKALRDDRISAAAFTGSLRGGRALFDIAAARPNPIPFYGELGSVNPVVVSPGAVAARGEPVATGFAGSFTLGAGQFCTKPGLLFLPEGHGLDETLIAATRAAAAQEMLNETIAEGYSRAVAEVVAQPGVRVLVDGTGDGLARTPTLVAVSGKDFRAARDVLGVECFGPASVVVEYAGPDELLDLVAELEPGLTATLHAQEDEAEFVRPLLTPLRRIAGRLLWNGWPTGVTVSWAQQHGGPYPATTAPTSTSVGLAAIERFLRPVAWQGFPDAFLPAELREDNPWRLPRRVDGEIRLP